MVTPQKVRPWHGVIRDHVHRSTQMHDRIQVWTSSDTNWVHTDSRDLCLV